MERWQDIPGYKGRYQASTAGRVRSLDRTLLLPCGQAHTYKGRILKPASNDSRGYKRVAVSGRSKYVHRLVAAAFHGPYPANGFEVLHSDHNPGNNEATNLKWGTRSENVIADLIAGTRHQKEIVGTALKDGAQTKYRNAGVAAHKLTGARQSAANIRACCRGTQKTAYGYTWIYA